MEKIKKPLRYALAIFGVLVAVFFLGYVVFVFNLV